jgi:hypothetical protein
MARGVYPWGMYHGGGFHVVGRVIGLFILAALFFGLMRLLLFGRMMRHYAFGHGRGPDGPLAHGGLPVGSAGRQIDLAEDDVNDPIDDLILVGEVVVDGHRLDPEFLAELPHAE